MTTWTWNFADARVADEDGLTEVVKEIQYSLTGTRGEDARPHTIGGRMTLSAPDPASFKPFANLTEADLIAFISSDVNIDALKLHIAAQLDAASQIKALPFKVA